MLAESSAEQERRASTAGAAASTTRRSSWALSSAAGDAVSVLRRATSEFLGPEVLEPSADDDLGIASVTEKELHTLARKLTSFDEGDKDLLRGVPLTYVLRAGCRLLSSSKGTAATHGLSQETSRLFAFISHNWSTSRVAKFLALAMLHNFDAAAIMSLSASSLLAALQVMGVFGSTVQQANIAPYASGYLCRCCTFPVFVGGLLFWQDLAALIVRPPLVFLDKSCIDQADPLRQQRGISKLGAFIGASESMVVLYSDTYLRKIWTTYEVASFLMLHDLAKLRIVPVAHAAVYFFGLLSFWLFVLAAFVLNVYSKLWFVRFIGDLAVAVAGVLAMRRWLRHRELAKQRLQTFSIQECCCAVESDREVVYDNIAALMMSFGHVGKLSSKADALEAFDVLVRGTLGRRFSAVLGARRIFQFRHYLFLGFIWNGGSALDYLSMGPGAAPQVVAASWGLDLFWTLAGCPLAVVAAEVISAVRWRTRGLRELALVVPLTTLTLLVPGLALFRGTRTLSHAAESSLFALIGLYALNVFGVWLLWWAVRPWPSPTGTSIREGCRDVGSPKLYSDTDASVSEMFPSPVGELQRAVV